MTSFLDSLFEEFEGRAQRFQKRTRRVSQICGWGMAVTATFFNIVALVPIFLGDNAGERIAHVLSEGDWWTGLLLMLNFATGVFLSWAITHCEIEGLGNFRHSKVAQVELIGGYFFGTTLNLSGMLVISSLPTEPVAKVTRLFIMLICAFLLDFLPEFIIEGTIERTEEESQLNPDSRLGRSFIVDKVITCPRCRAQVPLGELKCSRCGNTHLPKPVVI